MKIQYRLSSIFAVISLALIFSGCRFDYEETIMADDLAEEIPETILSKFSQVMVKDTIPTFYIEADESRTFGKKKETLFSGVHFQEYDKKGQVITDGRAENARMFNETENVELWGGLDFYSKREEASLEGEYLFWDNEKNTLSGKSGDRISIIKESGSRISGEGFFANSKTKTIKFSSSVTGSWINE